MPLRSTFLLAAAFFVCAVSSFARAGDNRPNILVIVADDHALRAIGAYGSSVVETPAIDRIAAEGAIFRNAFVTNSICSPSRAVLMTGKFSHRNGVSGNGQAFDGSQVTVQKLLQSAGYQTSIVGKWHLKSAPVGFDEWKVLIGQGEYYSPRFRSAEGIEQYDGAYVTDQITTIAIDMLSQRDSSKPFLMFYNHKAPHRNWMPRVSDLQPDKVRAVPVPADFNDDYRGRPAAKAADMRIADMFLSYDMKMQADEYLKETGTGGARGNAAGRDQAVAAWQSDYARLTADQRKRWDSFYAAENSSYESVKDEPGALAAWKYQRFMHDYTATVKALDENVGRVLDYLEEENLARNTVVVYTSDQGFYLGEHGWYDKRFMYEPTMRTPLLIRYPAVVDAGLSVSDLVQNIDFAPTLLQLADVPVPEEMQGLSLLPLIAGQQRGKLRSSLYYRYYGNATDWHKVHSHYGIRTERFKLIHFPGELDHWELFDLEADPSELKNLYGDPTYSDLQDQLHEQLLELAESYGDSLVAADPAL